VIKTPLQFSGQLEQVDCLFCGRCVYEEILWQDYRDSAIVRCKKCGLTYRNPRYLQSLQEEIFSNNWTEEREDFYLNDYRVFNLRRLADYIQNRMKAGRLLDVGCSYGTFLRFFSDSWELTGVEPSMSASRAASERLPRALIINDSIENVSLPKEHYDVITVIDTIYYLPYPLKVLIKFHNLLKKNGRLVIESPNFLNRYYFYRLISHNFDRTWMYFFMPETLSMLLERTDFALKSFLHIHSHSIGSRRIIRQLTARMEFKFCEFVWLLSKRKIDLHPHFVFVAVKR